MTLIWNNLVFYRDKNKKRPVFIKIIGGNLTKKRNLKKKREFVCKSKY